MARELLAEHCFRYRFPNIHFCRFRWVDCHLDGLRKCLRVNTVMPMLRALPKTLYGTYDRILMSIDELYVEDARRVLQWLVFSARPVSIPRHRCTQN
jgi:hypothetical protein